MLPVSVILLILHMNMPVKRPLMLLDSTSQNLRGHEEVFVDAVANEDGIWEAFVVPGNGNQYSLASVKVEPVWDGNVTTIVTNTYITVDNVIPSI